MMSNDLVESMIAAQEAWVLQFRLMATDPGTVGVIDRERIGNEHACDFGHYLDSGRVVFENDDLLRIARDLHGTFHGIAAMIVGEHDAGGERKVIAQYLAELETVAEQLTKLMRRARIVAD